LHVPFNLFFPVAKVVTNSLVAKNYFNLTTGFHILMTNITNLPAKQALLQLLYDIQLAMETFAAGCKTNKIYTIGKS